MFDISGLNIKERTGVYAPGQERVAQILQTALDLMIHVGFHAVTLREIARRCDIRVSAIHHYYKTRDDLVLDLLASVMNSYEELFVELRNASDDPADVQLKTFIVTILDDIQTLKTTNLFPELWTLANRNPDAAKMLDAIYVRSRAIVSRLIGRINPALDDRSRETLAVYLTASLEGLTVFAGHGKAWAAEMPLLKEIACTSLLMTVRSWKPSADPDPDWKPPTLLDAEAYRRLVDTDA